MEALCRYHRCMPGPTIADDEEHKAALREIETLWGATEGTPEDARLQALVGRIHDYEEQRWPVLNSDREAAASTQKSAEQF